MEPIRVGLVGIGRAGWGMHCPDISVREDKFRVAAACDIICERLDKMERRYGCKTYARIEDLLEDPEVELVDIATRSHQHFEHAHLALSAGKLVFLEKPMCQTYEEALKLKEAAGKTPGKRLFIRHNRRFEPSFVQVRNIINSGILGEVFEIKHAVYGYARRDDWQTIKEFGGGQLYNWGPHLVDHGLVLLGSPVESIFSDLKCIASAGDAEDHVKIIMRGTNGRLVDLEISGGVAIGSPSYLVYGTKGSLSLSNGVIELKYLDPGQKLAERKADPGTPGDTFGTPEALVWKNERLEVKKEGENIWDELFSAIRLGTTFPIDIDEAVRVMEVISRVKEQNQ